MRPYVRRPSVHKKSEHFTKKVRGGEGRKEELSLVCSGSVADFCSLVWSFSNWFKLQRSIRNHTNHVGLAQLRFSPFNSNWFLLSLPYPSPLSSFPHSTLSDILPERTHMLLNVQKEPMSSLHTLLRFVSNPFPMRCLFDY